MKEPIEAEFCLICMKPMRESFFKQLICDKCLEEMNPQLKRIKLDDTKGIGIYPYENKIKELLFNFKGRFDIALSDVFIFPYRNILKLRFFDYVVVPVPSFQKKNNLRGFNHVEKMFSCLNLRIISCLEKTKDIKQSSLSKEQRQEISKYIVLNNKSQFLKNKKVLLVDDVLTTGATLKCCINLLKKARIKGIFFLVMSYTCREWSQFEERKK